MFVKRGERGGRSDGPTPEHAAKRKAPKTRKRTATRSPARMTTARRTTATKTTRWSGAGRGGTGTGRGGARTHRRPQTTTYLQTTTPVNTVVSQITPSWWVHTGSSYTVPQKKKNYSVTVLSHNKHNKVSLVLTTYSSHTSKHP